MFDQDLNKISWRPRVRTGRTTVPSSILYVCWTNEYGFTLGHATLFYVFRQLFQRRVSKYPARAVFSSAFDQPFRKPTTRLTTFSRPGSAIGMHEITPIAKRVGVRTCMPTRARARALPNVVQMMVPVSKRLRILLGAQFGARFVLRPCRGQSIHLPSGR